MKPSWMHWANRALKISVLVVGNFLTGCGGCGNGHTSSTPAGTTQFNIVDLGTLTPTGIKNNSQIVGNVLSAGNLSKPAFWQNGALTMLQNLNGPNGFANAINDAGQIVGHAGGTAIQTYHAVLWASSTSAPTVLPAPTGTSDTFSDATAIDSNGDVVGFGAVSFLLHAIVWLHGGSAGTILPGPTGSTINALFSVNASGQTVGVSTSFPASAGSTLMLANITSSAPAQDLGIGITAASTNHFQGTVDVPVYINALGTIVGPQGADLGPGFAFIRLSNGQVTQLTSSPDQSTATGINAGGTVIVDINPDSAGQTPKCAVYDTVHGLRDLNTLVTSGAGWQLQFASGINDKGQIVGSGQFQGSTHGFLLTPVTTNN